MSHLSVRIWKAPRPTEYPLVFQKQVVREYESGVLNKDQLARKYGIKGKSTVLSWCRKFDKFDYSSTMQNGRPMKDPQSQRIKELEAKLLAAEQKLLCLSPLNTWTKLSNQFSHLNLGYGKIETELFC